MGHWYGGEHYLHSHSSGPREVISPPWLARELWHGPLQWKRRLHRQWWVLLESRSRCAKASTYSNFQPSQPSLPYWEGEFLIFPSSSTLWTSNFKYLKSAISVSIEANLLVNDLSAQIFRYINSVFPQTIFKAESLNLLSVTKTSTILKSLRKIYAKVISEIMIFALIIICVAVLIACDMKWVNIKKVSVRRKQKTTDLSMSLKMISSQRSTKNQIDRAVIDHV